MRRIEAVLALLCALLTCCIASWAQRVGKEDDKQDTQAARSVYLEIVRISRMPFEAREKQIPTLYRDLDQAMASLSDRQSRYARTGIVGDNKIFALETHEEFADRMAAKNAWLPLLSAARALQHEVFKKHTQALIPLVREDLRSPDSEKQLRGLRTATSINMPMLFEDVVALYLKPANLGITQTATSALRLMDDPRTRDRILPLLTTPPYPENYFALLRDFSANRPAPPELLQYLDSQDFRLRREALTTLIPSGDPKLVPYVLKFLIDKDGEIRLAAAGIGLNLTGSAAREVRPAVLKMLQDPERMNRLNVAWKLAEQKDLVAGPTLLALLQDDTLDQAWHSNVVQAMNTLAGSYFGYDFGDWKPTTANNRAAIAKFAEWVAAHPSRKE